MATFFNAQTIDNQTTFNQNIIGNSNITCQGAVLSESSRTTVNGSTLGSIIWSMPFQGQSYKKVMIFVNGLTGTASFTFPTAFTHTPAAASNSDQISTSAVTALTTTGCTITGIAADTGNVWIEGF